MTRQHEDFIYQPEPKSEPVKSAQRTHNDLAHRAASLAWKISNEIKDPTCWRAAIEAAPVELRDLLRTYLTQKYQALKDRERRAAGGKQSDVGNQELAKIGKKVGAL